MRRTAASSSSPSMLLLQPILLLCFWIVDLCSHNPSIRSLRGAPTSIFSFFDPGAATLLFFRYRIPHALQSD